METKKANVDKESEILYKRILKMLPATQSDIWKKLKIERRKCSRIMAKMEKLCFIKKTKIKGGSFMVERVNEIVKDVPKANFSALLSTNGTISPCCGCQLECNPAFCMVIDKWIKDDIKV